MYEQLKLENQICFPLYALSKEITRQYTPFLNELDLTYPQYLVMLVLWEQDGRTVNQIGAKLLLDSGTLTPLLKRLQEKNFISRQRSLKDERTVLISLTELGKSLQHKASEIPQKMASCLKLDLAEIAVLHKIVSQFQANQS